MNLNKLLDKLLKEGKIKRQKTDLDYLNGLLEAAQRNFLAAKYNLKNEFPEIAFKAAYEGLLQLSRVVLLSNGFRPDDGEQHKTTFVVAGMILGKEFGDLIERIDRYRIKRNQSIYQPLCPLSKSEAEGILETAEEYWNVVKKYLKKQNKQLELFNF